MKLRSLFILVAKKASCAAGTPWTFLAAVTQNADTAAIQIKLDGLIRATKGANNELLDLEELDEERLEEIRREYERMAREACNALDRARRCHGDGRADDP